MATSAKQVKPTTIQARATVLFTERVQGRWGNQNVVAGTEPEQKEVEKDGEVEKYDDYGYEHDIDRQVANFLYASESGHATVVLLDGWLHREGAAKVIAQLLATRTEV